MQRRLLLQSLGSAAMLAALPARAADPAASRTAPRTMRAILLGTQGGPNFNLVRGESASVVVVDDRLYLVDCGYGALGALVRADLNYRNVGQIFLTHLHDDHAAIRYNEVNEEIRLVDEARSARIASLFSAREIAVSAQPAKVFEDADVTVRSVENTHYPATSKQHSVQRSLALRFDARGRSIVFSGDTAYSQNLIQLARGAEVLVCEAMHVAATRKSFDERVAAGAYADNPEGIWTHIVDTHTPLDVAGKMAREAGVHTLVLNHLIPGGWNPELDDEFYRREAAREFDGEIIVGRDGLEI